MKNRRSLFRRVVDRLTGKKPPAPAAPPPAELKEKPPHRRTDSSFEPLEGRIAPALLLNPTTIQFTDTDGDLVTVKFSKSFFSTDPLERNGDLDQVFKFLNPDHHVRTAADGGLASDVDSLAMLDLSILANIGAKNPAAGTDITISATKLTANGDDHVNVGYIKAKGSAVFGISLGKVTVDGDLGRIEAGDFSKVTGLTSLTVESLGAVGLTSQLANGTLDSNVTGAVGKIVVKTNITDATIRIINGTSATKNAGNLGSLFIGGNLQVKTATTTANAAFISVEGKIGSIEAGNILGGAGDNSAQIKTSRAIGKVTIHGDLRGGAGKDSGEINGGSFGAISLNNLWSGTGENSGRILSNGNVSKLTVFAIKGAKTFADGISGINAATISVAGNVGAVTIFDGIYGGEKDDSGSIAVAAKISTLTVGRLVGGDGDNTGQLKAGALGTVTVTNNLQGGEGEETGSIISLGAWTKVTVKNLDLASAGALVGGIGFRSGSLTATGSLGTAIIAGTLDGSVTASGDRAGAIGAGGNIGSITVSGSLRGGAGELTGSISAGGTIGTVKTGSLFGAAGDFSGSISAARQISSVTIEGSLDGGTGASSASVIAGSDVANPSNLNKIVVTGKLLGDGIDSASIRAGGKIVSLTIGDKLLPTQVVLEGGSGGNSATIVGATGITSATIWGSVKGGGGTNSGSLQATGLIGTVKISGNLQGAVGIKSGSIQAHEKLAGAKYITGDLGSITVTGDLLGAGGEGSGQIFADGSAKSITLGSMSGGAGARSGSILLGQGEAGFPDDFKTIGGAGTITVKGAISGSATSGGIEALSQIRTLTTGSVTGARILTGYDFGTVTINGAVTDALFVAQGSAKATAKADLTIGKLTINGNVSGTKFLAGYDRFGNATNGNAQIGTVKVTGNWTGSSLVAGVQDVEGDGFGDDDDTVIGTGTLSKIASITITGLVTETAAPDDRFGFVAREVTAMKVGTVVQALNTDKNTIPLAPDTFIHEVP